MLGWLWQALRTGIVTTRYPAVAEPQPGGAAGRVAIDPGRWRRGDAEACAAACPTGAMRIEGPVFRFDAGRCILCRRCVGACSDGAVTLVADYEVAVRRREDLVIEIEAGDD